MTATITIDKEHIRTEVRKTTCYKGAKSTDAADYSRIGCTPADNEMLELCFTGCLSAALDRLRRCLVSVTDNTDSATIVINLHQGADRATAGLIAADLTDFFIAGVTARWFEITGTDDSRVRHQAACECLESALRKVMSKPRPRRPQLR